VSVTVISGGASSIDLARMLRSPVIRKPPELVLIGDDLPALPPDLPGVTVINGDPTDQDVLERAGISRARMAIMLTDERHRPNPDAHTLLVALAIEEIAPTVYTIVEVQDSNNMPHFDRTAVDETVCRSELSELLIAQAALNHHISGIYRELYTYQTDGNEIYRMGVRDHWKTFRTAFDELIEERVIPIGIRREGKNQLNPLADTPLEPGDMMWVIALEQS